MDEVKMVNYGMRYSIDNDAPRRRRAGRSAVGSGIEAVPGVRHQRDAPIMETIRADREIKYAIDQQYYAMLEFAEQPNDPVRQSETMVLANLFREQHRELHAESSAPMSDR